MPKEFKGIVLSRLFILIAIFTVPIIIFLIFILTEFDLWFTTDVRVSVAIVKILVPSVFAISWLYFMLLFANRFSETIEAMGSTVGIIPLRLKIFYGINAIFVLFIFVFPLITPVVSILSFASMMWQLTTYKKESWDEDTKTPFITKFLMVLVSILPIFCTISVIPEYFDLSFFLWNNIWMILLPHIFIFSYCLCTSLAIGSLFILIVNRGVSEYEELFADPSKTESMMNVKILEVFLFAFFLFLDYGGFEVIELFYNVGFFLVLFVSIVNYISGKSKMKQFNSHVFGYLLAAVFMGSNLLILNVQLSEFLQAASLSIFAEVFIVVYIYTFKSHQETEF